MNLVVDAGNTFVKLAVFEKTKEVSFQVFALEDFCKKSKETFKAYPQISHAIVSSVGFLSEKEIAMLCVFCKVHVLSHKSKVPFKNSYASPQTLGVDRMALAAAAFYFNPAGNTLVIDAGTCLTYDMVNDYGEYLGGAISPGVAMRYRAMHQQTSKLPLLEKGGFNDFIGNSTESSMHSGVVNGICNEIDGVITQYKQRFLNLTVIFTGGDAQFLSERVKNTIFAHSKFLLLGLNHLLEYNKR
ncbi:type III pantothenate kinase [Arenibacter sp. 6A1]|uniref:type III pantothenate kinase n=1 Tax=Arenibacter sp. 6A1 TaxID=2720391 RepID=UPI001446BD6B|nr:type III pantothenate kinase [Arenibacter sp. 6A1]NKI26076.1 type III pantothenate kinase [Arenibacter sp. 6A1]